MLAKITVIGNINVILSLRRIKVQY